MLTYDLPPSELPLLRLLYHNTYGYVKICDGGTGRISQILKQTPGPTES